MSVYNEYNEVICDYECNKCLNVTNCVDRVENITNESLNDFSDNNKEQ